mmetsp:Transcript_10534/g.34091  ORF Transcript_10534/g.34091 Transcript_10534/m.34091 type:complete len:374 (-) Transcript_10534:130-1251(-)
MSALMLSPPGAVARVSGGARGTAPAVALRGSSFAPGLRIRDRAPAVGAPRGASVISAGLRRKKKASAEEADLAAAEADDAADETVVVKPVAAAPAMPLQATATPPVMQYTPAIATPALPPPPPPAPAKGNSVPWWMWVGAGLLLAKGFDKMMGMVKTNAQKMMMDQMMKQMGGGAAPGGSSEEFYWGMLNMALASSINKVGGDYWPARFARGGMQKPTVGLRIAHRRIGGLPLRVYSALEMRFQGWDHTHPEKLDSTKLVSLGALWRVPWTRGVLQVGVAAVDQTPDIEAIHFSAWEATGRVELGPLKLEGGWGGKAAPWEVPRRQWDQGRVWGMGLRVLDIELRDMLTLNEVRILGLPLYKCVKPQTPKPKP